MLLTLRAALGCIGLSGGACATIIPITIYSREANNLNDFDGPVDLQELKLTKCTEISNREGESIIFGSDVTDPFCWKLKDSGGKKTSEKESIDTSLTELLKKKGKNIQTFSSGDTAGRAGMCVVGGSGPQGVLSDSSESGLTNVSVKYIGSCNISTTHSSTVSFLEIGNGSAEGKNPALKLCYQDCGTINQTESSSNILNFQNKIHSNWKELTFLKQS